VVFTTIDLYTNENFVFYVSSTGVAGFAYTRPSSVLGVLVPGHGIDPGD